MWVSYGRGRGGGGRRQRSKANLDRKRVRCNIPPRPPLSRLRVEEENLPTPSGLDTEHVAKDVGVFVRAPQRAKSALYACLVEGGPPAPREGACIRYPRPHVGKAVLEFMVTT